MTKLAPSVALMVLLSTYPITSFAASPTDDSIGCVLKQDASWNSVLETGGLYARLGIFENIRRQGGEKWSREAWAGRFQEFNTEMSLAFEPLMAKERALQDQRFREIFKNDFTSDELAQLCTILQDPYFAEFGTRSAKNAAIMNEALTASASGLALSDKEKQELMARAQAAEQEMRSFAAANREKVNRFASTPAFRHHMEVLQAELRVFAERVQAMMADPAMKAVLSKWRTVSEQGPNNKARQ